ncbi:hypothetical protein SAMN05444380_11922 [Thermophagus xiamenensis]|uniref:Uncharacterized protein n=1 Tax=Thermophagus xiamenensis TaxID=385682 RepID=A0A1I2DJ81_9BACT|nr:hypothetical protein SAMN05444380_11922 [Thermophagus xiamenensis]
MELAWLNKIYTCPFVATAAMLVSFVTNPLTLMTVD